LSQKRRWGKHNLQDAELRRASYKPVKKGKGRKEQEETSQQREKRGRGLFNPHERQLEKEAAEKKWIKKSVFAPGAGTAHPPEPFGTRDWILKTRKKVRSKATRAGSTGPGEGKVEVELGLKWQRAEVSNYFLHPKKTSRRERGGRKIEDPHGQKTRGLTLSLCL